MKISDFDRSINETILARGYEYYKAGRIVSLEQNEPGIYSAIVEGTDTYLVNVQMNDDGEIIEANCDCPYDKGAWCKHHAAVLYMIRHMNGTNLIDDEVENRKYRHEPNKESDSKGKTAEKVKSLLSGQPAEEVLRFLCGLAADNKNVLNRIELLFTQADDETELSICRNYIKTCIQADQLNTEDDDESYDDDMWDDDDDWDEDEEWDNDDDRDENEDWDEDDEEDTDDAWDTSVDTPIAASRAVLEKAAMAVKSGRELHGLKIALCVVKEIVIQFEREDALDDWLYDIIGGCLLFIDGVIDGLKADNVKSAALLNILMDEFESHEYASSPLLQMELFDNCVAAAGNAGLQKRLIARMEKALDKVDPAIRKTLAEKFYYQLYLLISSYYGIDRAKEFQSKNLRIPKCRSMVIEDALASGEYDKAIHAAQDGAAQDRGDARLATIWKDYLLKAYGASGNVEKQREVAAALVLQGKLPYLSNLKSTYDTQEWQAAYENLLGRIDISRFGDYYATILIHENDKCGLLAYVQKRPDELERYTKYILPEYKGEVYKLFRERIARLAQSSFERRGYRAVCDTIKKLLEAGGVREAVEIRRELLCLYTKKTAFKEELSNIQIPPIDNEIFVLLS